MDSIYLTGITFVTIHQKEREKGGYVESHVGRRSPSRLISDRAFMRSPTDQRGPGEFLTTTRRTNVTNAKPTVRIEFSLAEPVCVCVPEISNSKFNKSESVRIDPTCPPRENNAVAKSVVREIFIGRTQRAWNVHLPVILCLQVLCIFPENSSRPMMA